MGRYIPNSTENGIATGVQMNAQNINAMRDLQNTKAQAESVNRQAEMKRVFELEDDLMNGPDPELSKHWSAEKLDLWKKNKQEEIRSHHSALGMFLDADGELDYQANPYATSAVDSGYASKAVDQDIIHQAFNYREIKDDKGNVTGSVLDFSNPDTAAYAQTLGIKPGMSEDEIRSRIQGKQKDLLDIMGDSYQTNPVVQHYGAYNSPQHDAVKEWGMGKPGLGISYANVPPLLYTSNEPIQVPGSETPFDQDAFTRIDIPARKFKHGVTYNASKPPANTAYPPAQPADYVNPYTDYLDKLMVKNSPQSSVPYAPPAVMPQMQQSPLPGVSQYQDPYGTMLPRVNYNLPYKGTK